ncbi:MAG: hypothetical protein ABIQ95_12905 [Bdellovibrionia bacterium]
MSLVVTGIAVTGGAFFIGGVAAIGGVAVIGGVTGTGDAAVSAGGFAVIGGTLATEGTSTEDPGTAVSAGGLAVTGGTFATEGTSSEDPDAREGLNELGTSEKAKGRAGHPKVKAIKYTQIRISFSGIIEKIYSFLIGFERSKSSLRGTLSKFCNAPRLMNVCDGTLGRSTILHCPPKVPNKVKFISIHLTKIIAG